MLEAEDLKEISEAFKSKDQITLKDIHYVMQDLVESMEHLTSLMIRAQEEEDILSTINSPNVHGFFLALAKGSDDFNDAIVEYIIENDILEAGIDFIEDLEDDDEN